MTRISNWEFGWTHFRREIGPMTELAVPIVLSNLGWMAMAIVDTMMVGRVSAEAIGAVSLGGVIFSTLGTFGGGVMFGLDTLVSQAFGAGDLEDCRHSLLSALYLGLPLSAVLMGLLWAFTPLLGRLGINPVVLRQAVPYLHVLTWCTPPLLAYFALRSYLQAINLAKAVTFALVTANLLNALGDWVLIYGHWGAPAMGAVGSAWSTTASRFYMAAVLAAVVLHRERRHLSHPKTAEHERGPVLATPRDPERVEHVEAGSFGGANSLPFRNVAGLMPDLARIRRVLALGLPAATQILVEIAVFAAATALIARLDPISLAAHQIAIQTVTLTYMVPLGIGAAAAVRVGQALGRRDPEAARHSGWTALALGVGFMGASALTLLLAPRAIARAFTPDPAIIRAGASLLVIGAFFQLFDGTQVVATGALRGAGDTRTPMLCHAAMYWLIGLPLGYFLCFRKGWGARGLWVGLCVALILIGITLLGVWKRRVEKLGGAMVR